MSVRKPSVQPVPIPKPTGPKGWMEKAACRGMDVNLFFPPAGTNISQEIRDICGSCPVRPECFDYATRNNIDIGIFGGEPAITRIRARRRRAAGARR